MTRSVADIFNEARDIPEAERAVFLRGACGRDSTLRTKVEALLRADVEAGGFMAKPTGDQGGASMLSLHFEAASDIAPSEQVGKSIGPYKLLEKIGEGGFGTVWMAEQREPVKRRVAIKLIKLGMDTKQVIARFEAERQALAMMDHPNIAKVLDAGSTDAGRPYFVMEYIRGIPILEYCDRELLDTKARLRLFTDVCHAIQHAHHKGIIHRDIKPTNVLVTMHDGVPVPKVIDFGIAKATNSELTTKTLFTEHRQMIGTPAYMSPEQAEMSALDIDTRSDIYSLGVLLYEMLTGTTPFDVYDLRAKGHEEMLRIIREDEPHKPSTRVSTLGEDASQAAKHRCAHDPRRLSGLLRGDLDWIVMKCLEKDRTRRYETANGLAADVQRHLRNEPITAGAPGAAHRLRKFVRRNRGKVVAASLVTFALVFGVIGTTGGMIWAQNERDRAADARRNAESATAAELVARDAAQLSAEKARVAAQHAKDAKEQEGTARKRAESISEFMVTALKSSDANAGGSQDMTILAAMDRAIADLDSGRFRDDPDTEAHLKGTIGTVLQNNGRVQQAEPLLTQQMETLQRLYPGDHSCVCTHVNELGLALLALGRITEAESHFVRSLGMAQRLFPGDHREVSATLAHLGAARVALGRTADAETLFGRALEMEMRLHRGDHAEVAKALDNLGKVRGSLGRHAEAEELVERALSMRKRLDPRDRPDLAVGLHNLGAARVDLGRLAEAEALYQAALQMNQRLFGGDHPQIAQCMTSVAGTRCRRDNFAGAEPIARQAVEMSRRLYPGDHPQVALALHLLALSVRGSGRLEESEPLYVEAMEINRRALPPGHRDRLISKSALARVYWWERKLDRSIPLFESLLKEEEAVWGRQHPETHGTIVYLGMNYRAAERYADAIPLLEEGLKQSVQVPDLRISAQHLLDCYHGVGEAVVASRAAAVKAFLTDILAEARGREANGSNELSHSLSKCGLIWIWLGDSAKAEPLLAECVAIREQGMPDDWRTFNAQSQLGGALQSQGKVAEAEPLLLAGYRGMKSREAVIPPQAAIRIPEALERLVKLYEAKSDATQAAVWRATLLAARTTESRPASRAGH